MKPKVVYWNNMPSPYMVERFNAIAARGNLDFEAWFDAERESDRSWDVCPAHWGFRASYLHSRPAPRLLDVGRRLRARPPDVLVTLYSTPTFAAGALLAKAMGVKVVLRALKVFDTWRPRTRARSLAKRLLFPRVDAIQVAGPDSRDYVVSCGARPDSVVEFPEPVHVAHFASGSLCAADRDARRAMLGLRGCVFLYVGRLWRGKGLDYLIDAYSRLRAEGSEASLLLVGDGVDERRYRAMAAGLPNVVFAGFVQEPLLPQWYSLADAMVFPTLGDPYGHVVQEAMAASLPVIATENAGDILDRVIDSLTGYVVPAADSEALLSAMRALAANSTLRRDMGQRGYEHIRGRTVEWWASEFESMVARIASAPQRSASGKSADTRAA